MKDALAAFQAGDLGNAERLCRSALKPGPPSFDALHLLGLVMARRGDLTEAERLFRRALALNPRAAPAHLNHGNALRALKRFDEALAAYDRAIALKGDYAQAFGNRGTLLLGLGRREEAEAAYRRAIALAPGDAAGHAGLGNALKDQGRLADAVAAYLKAVEVGPGYADAYNNLGNALKDQGKPDEAVAAYERAAKLKPADPHVQDNLGAGFYAQGRMAEAVAAHRRALQLKAAASGVSRKTEAICEALIDLIGMPAIYDDDAGIAAARKEFAGVVDRLKGLCADHGPAADGKDQDLVTECLFKLNLFFLAYQQQDDRRLMEDYASIATALLRPQVGPYLAPVRRRARGARIRLGVASELLMNHNGANWLYPWLAGLPQTDYEFFLYALNGAPDWLTEKFAALGTFRRLPFGAATYLAGLARIRADDLDVLVIPDVGMTAASRILALTRLAPVQCAGWGHPVTTGSSMVDYYLSFDSMEPADGQDRYTETLVRLPDPCFFVNDSGPGDVHSIRRRHGLPPDKPIFGSVQSLFKYLPRYDDLYARIAEAVPDSLFVFIGHGSFHTTKAFAGRLRRAFAGRGLDFDGRARILPHMPHGRFVALLGAIDVNLDTIGWNGANTTIHAFLRGCPVVTFPGASMRGRHGLGLLRQIGVDELVAPSLDGYVALAARLAADKGFRAAMSEKVAHGSARLTDCGPCCRFLDTFFKGKAAGPN